MGLRRTVTFEVDGHEVSLEVTHRVVEVLERVYDENLAYIVGLELAVDMRVKRSKVAECLAEWIAQSGVQLPLKRRQILDWVMGSTGEELRVYIGCLQAAALSCLRDSGDGKPLDDEDFAALVAGKDRPSIARARAAAAPAAPDGEAAKKNAEEEPPPTPTSDTSSPAINSQ